MPLLAALTRLIDVPLVAYVALCRVLPLPAGTLHARGRGPSRSRQAPSDRLRPAQPRVREVLHARRGHEPAHAGRLQGRDPPPSPRATAGRSSAPSPDQDPVHRASGRGMDPLPRADRARRQQQLAAGRPKWVLPDRGRARAPCLAAGLLAAPALGRHPGLIGVRPERVRRNPRLAAGLPLFPLLPEPLPGGHGDGGASRDEPRGEPSASSARRARPSSWSASGRSGTAIS